MGTGRDPAPRWLGNILATVLERVGPRGLEFGRYSIEYHYIRNWLHVMRAWGPERAERHLPSFAKEIVARYDKDGALTKRCGCCTQPAAGTAL